MRLRAAFALSVLLTPGIAPAQYMSARAIGGAGNEWGSWIAPTSDYGYVAAGRTDSYGAGGSDLYVVKLSAAGTVEWSRAIGGPQSDVGRCVAQTRDGGYIVSGETQSFGDPQFEDLLVLKLSAAGLLEWARVVSGPFHDRGMAVVEGADGNYLVVGDSDSFSGSGLGDLFLARFSPSGLCQWVKTAGGDWYDVGLTVVATPDSGYAVTGIGGYAPGDGLSDLLLAKLSSTGSVEWARTVGGSENDNGEGLTATSDGGYVVVGEGESFGIGYLDCVAVKFSSTGSIQWARVFGGAGGHDDAYSVVEADDGGYVVAGFTNSFGAGLLDWLVLKLSTGGALAWAETLGGTLHDEAHCIAKTVNGYVTLAGNSWNFGASGSDLMVATFGDDGRNCLAQDAAVTFTDLPDLVARPMLLGSVPALAEVFEPVLAVTAVTPANLLLCLNDGVLPEEERNGLATAPLALSPNPFRSVCEIRVDPSWTGGGPFRVEVRDIGGRLIWRASAGDARTGQAWATPRGTEGAGILWHPDPWVPSGIYFARVEGGGGASASGRVLYLR